MSARCLLSGVVHRVAQKTSAAGKPYLMVTVREGSGDAVRWWTVFVFHEAAVEEIERLSPGDAIAFSGKFEAKIYAPNGVEPRVSLTMVADAVISTRAPKKKSSDRATKTASTQPTEREFDDSIPF